MKRLRRLLWLVLLLTAVTFRDGHGQELIWEATACFQYVLEPGDIQFNPATRVVTVDFAVVNPSAMSAACQKYGTKTSWDVLNDLPFKQSPALSTLRVLIGWTTKEFTNTGSAGSLVTKPWGGGLGAALPITVDALRGAAKAVPLGDKFRVVSGPLPPQAVISGRVAIEGHPAWQDQGGVWLRVPVTSQVQDFVIDSAVARREIVDTAKCKVCHNGSTKDEAGTAIPRLVLHGANRNENVNLCVVCHNPDQTDIPYRTTGAEVPIHFKTMVHSIHSATIRRQPFIVIGFQGSVNDFSSVRFPADLKNCAHCHVGNSFEIGPTSAVATYARGTTVETLSVPGKSVDVDPSNNFRITPIAATCSACHDDAANRRHMQSQGASFRIQQADIRYWGGSIAGMERCPACHGPGKEKDVRKIHDVGGDD